MPKKQHGGFRSGAGRPKTQHQKKKITITLSAEAIDIANSLDPVMSRAVEKALVAIAALKSIPMYSPQGLLLSRAEYENCPKKGLKEGDFVILRDGIFKLKNNLDIQS